MDLRNGLGETFHAPDVRTDRCFVQREKGIRDDRVKVLNLFCTPIATPSEVHDLSNAWSRPRKWGFQFLTVNSRTLLFEGAVSFNCRNVLI